MAPDSWIYDNSTTGGYRDLTGATSSPYDATGSQNIISTKDLKIIDLESKVTKLDNLLYRERELHQKTNIQLRNINNKLSLFVQAACMVADVDEIKKHIDKIVNAEINKIKFKKLLDEEIENLELEKTNF